MTAHPELVEGQAQGDPYAQAMQAALRFVSFRPRSVAEVRRRVGRDFEQPVVERTLESLRRYGYLDDAEFARQWRNSRERRKPRGAFLLRRELRGKGVSGELIDAALAGLDEADGAYRAGHKPARRWLAGGAMPYPEFRRKMWDYLRRRGFGSGVAGETIGRLWRDCAPGDGGG